MNELKIGIMLMFLVACGFFSGYFVGAGTENARGRAVIDDLRREIDLGRAGYDKLAKENEKLIGLNRASTETTEAIRRVIAEGEADLSRGISTIREAILLVRAIKERDDKIKAILTSQKLGDSWFSGDGNR